MPHPDDIEAALSLERFGRYVEWANGDRQRAVALYTYNARISEALTIPLHGLEIALRNRIHTVMSEQAGERWFDQPDLLLAPHQQAQVLDAIGELEGNGKDATAGRIVAGLSFSFWTAMFSPAYEDLWRAALHRIALRSGGKGLTRKAFSKPLTPIRLLRNRVAHHEPILHWTLPRHHRNMLELTSWLSPVVHSWTTSIDRFDQVYGGDYGVTHLGGVSVAGGAQKSG